MRFKRESKGIGRKVVFYALICVFLAVFLFCAIYLISYYVASQKQGNLYSDLGSQVDQLRATLPTETEPIPAPTDPNTGETVVTEPTEPTEPSILPEYAPVYELNSDMVGWITVPDTKINYPVMQTPDQTDYYLKHNFDKQWSDWGAIYAREVCDINRPSDNITLYGHHMKDGSMFAGLDNFKKESFWRDHQTFTFDTLYERHTYQIIAVFKTSANYGEGFLYHQFTDAQNEEEFNEFVDTVKSLAFYETGITAEYGDKLLTLSTCEYTQENGRFVVVAKRIS